MQQDTFFQREEVAAAELGALEGEHTLNYWLLRAFCIPFLVFLLIGIFTVLSQPGNLSGAYHLFVFFIGIDFAIFMPLFSLGILLGIYLCYKDVHLYVYTNGLFYLNRNKRRVIYWSQIKRAPMRRGFMKIATFDGLTVVIPPITHLTALRARIEREMARRSSLGLSRWRNRPSNWL